MFELIQNGRKIYTFLNEAEISVLRHGGVIATPGNKTQRQEKSIEIKKVLSFLQNRKMII